MQRLITLLSLTLLPILASADVTSQCRADLISELEEVANMDENGTGDTGYTCRLTGETWAQDPGEKGCELSLDFTATCENSRNSFSTAGGYCCP